MWLKRLLGFQARRIPLFLYNTLGKAKQEFTLPKYSSTVRMYNCGPTVYDVQHIGNLSAFVFADLLRRTLEYNSYSVKQVVNITDVGHLTSDSDEGEDKMSKGLRREGLEPTLENMLTLGERYTQVFLEDLRKLNIDTERITFPRASSYIAAQIAMVKTLEEKGYAYKAEDGMYFDTARFPSYGVLGGTNLVELKERARIETKATKRSPTDFALWKLNLPAEASAQAGEKIGWDSPWGKGFPGWHIECSAMINATLGKQIDIHTGGIEHISIHHNNEIAQSEVATGKKPFSRFWMHRAHIQFDGGKMAKSEGNVVYLSDVLKRGFNPLSLRYLFLGAHYRTPANFTWEALEGASNSLLNLYESYQNNLGGADGDANAYIGRFLERINDDIDTPGALAVLWEMTRDSAVSPGAKSEAMRKFDLVLGLDIAAHESAPDVPKSIQDLVDKRESARREKDWVRADELRAEIEKEGYAVKDTESGPRVSKSRTTPSQQN